MTDNQLLALIRSELVSVTPKIVEPHELADQETLFGRKALRAVAVETVTRGVPRPRTIYIHTSKDGVMSVDTFNENKPIVPGDITSLSYDDFVLYKERYEAKEHVFDNFGRLGSGGTECETIGPNDTKTCCVVCFDKIDLLDPDTIFSPVTGGDQMVRSWSAYLISTCSGRSLCNKCYRAGFTNEGQRVNTLKHLFPQLGDMKRVQLGNNEMGIKGLTAHASRRIPRLGAKVRITEPMILSLQWYELGTGTVSEMEDYIGDVEERESHAPGSRFILVAEPPQEWWGISIDTYDRKLNGTILIYCAAVVEDYDEEGDPVYRALTILPTIASRDVRPSPSQSSHQIRFIDPEPLHITKDMATHMIDGGIFLVREGFNYFKNLGHMAITMSDFSSPIVVKPFYLMSSYFDRRCYSCHRCYRSDIRTQCCGTICSFSGRVPSYKGTTMSKALFEYFKGTPRGCILEKETTTYPLQCFDGDHDIYILRSTTRCELSGKCFICTDVNGRLARPRMLVRMDDSVEYASCVACWSKMRIAGLVQSIRKIPDNYSQEYYFVIRITDRKEYEDGLNCLFNVVEVPTLFPKRSPLSFDIDKNGRRSAPLINYLVSSQGYECELITPYSVNSGNIKDSVQECDAWDNQYRMSYSHPVTAGLSEDPAYGTQMVRKDESKIKTMLGDKCVALPFLDGLDVHNNTRFVIRTEYRTSTYNPVINDPVRSMIPWLNDLPYPYLLSLVHSLIQYRSALMHVFESHEPVAKHNAGLGFGISRDTTGEEVASKILTWGNGSTSKFSSKAFSVDRFGYRMPEDSIDYQMITYAKEDTSCIIQWIITRFSLKDSMVARSSNEWIAVINGRPIEALTSLMEGSSGIRESFERIVCKIREAKGIADEIDNPSYVKDSAMYLAKRSVYNRTSKLWELADCKLKGLPERPQRTFREIWSENFALMNQRDPRIKYDREEIDATGIDTNSDNTEPTPPFIWSQAIRTPSRLYAVTSAQVMNVRKNRTMRYSLQGAQNNEYINMFSRCYIIWDKGPVIRFKGSDISMTWGTNLRNSTLLSSRIVTTLQQGSNSMMVVSLRETQIYALDVFRSEWFGSR